MSLFARASRFAAALFLIAQIATPSAAATAPTQALAPMVQASPAEIIAPQMPQPDAGIDIAAVPPVPLTLAELVASYVDPGTQDAEELCLAKAVYFEARGETLEGQLAVAEVVLNRAASGRYPTTLCRVVTQPRQFSFVRRGRFPRVDSNCEAWRTARAIAHAARNDLARTLAPNVLWYHASYVSPAWGRRLTRVVTIGTHIFYS
jgi:hypothetical protein